MKIMKKKGSALIVAMLLIAGVGAVAFGIGRLLFVETKTATLYENGIVAYYAAESGVEEGFLRYKFDRNADLPASEVPQDGDPVGQTYFINFNNDSTIRTNLSDKTVAAGSKSFSTLINVSDDAAYQTKQIYDLKISYLGTDSKPWYGHDVANTIGTGAPDGQLTKEDLLNSNYSLAGSDYSVLKINQDSSAKIDLTNIQTNLVSGAKIMLLFEGDMSSTTNKCRAMAQLKLSVEDSAGTAREFKDLTNYNQTICSSVIAIDQNKLMPAISEDSINNTYIYYEIDLKEMLNRAGFTLSNNNSSVVLTVRPLYSGVKYGLYASDCNSSPALCTTLAKVISGPFTAIKSVGYYGGVARTLMANVDRQSGTLYDLFDYVIFSEQ